MALSQPMAPGLSLPWKTLLGERGLFWLLRATECAKLGQVIPFAKPGTNRLDWFNLVGPVCVDQSFDDFLISRWHGGALGAGCGPSDMERGERVPLGGILVQ